MEAQKKTRYIWPENATRFVRKASQSKDKARNAVLLHNQLEELTGFSADACWRFLQRHGIERPGTGKRKIWDTALVVEYVMEHGYKAAAQKFACSPHALYSLMQREKRVIGHCSGQYGLNQLRKLLNIRIETIKGWIRIGVLEATPVLHGGKSTFVVSDDQLRRFLRREAGSLLPRGFPEKRVEFLSNYLFDKHMDLVCCPRNS